MYAATATFYECLTGRPPFTGDTAERLLYQHLSEPVPLEPVPEPLRPLVAAGLAKDPGGRPADGAALVAELRTVAGGAYGPDWEDRGRSGLARRRCCWPRCGRRAGRPPCRAATVHRVRLRRHLRHGHVGPAKAAVAAGVAVAVGVAVAGVVATHTRSAEPAAASFTVSGGLGGVAAASADSAWAVGCPAQRECAKPLILRWNGTTWTRVPSPDLGTAYDISSVAAASAGSAWAVGCTGNGPARHQRQDADPALERHRLDAGAQPGPRTTATSHGVAATSAGSAWAVGWYRQRHQRTRDPAVERHGLDDRCPVLARGMRRLAAWPPSRPTAPGRSASGSPDVLGTLILRWNGTTWTRVPSPSPGQDSPHHRRGRRLRRQRLGGRLHRLQHQLHGLVFMHWNGNAWTTVPSPSPADSYLDGVAAAPDGSAWAVGWTGSGTSHRQDADPAVERHGLDAGAQPETPDPTPGSSA